MEYIITYKVILDSETLDNKQIIVKNKSSELIAKVSLEEYLRRKYGDSFKQLVIYHCSENDIMSMFNSIFGV